MTWMEQIPISIKNRKRSASIYRENKEIRTVHKTVRGRGEVGRLISNKRQRRQSIGHAGREV